MGYAGGGACVGKEATAGWEPRGPAAAVEKMDATSAEAQVKLGGAGEHDEATDDAIEDEEPRLQDTGG